MSDLRFAMTVMPRNSSSGSSQPLPIATASLGGRRKWSEEHEDLSWDEIPSPYSLFGSAHRNDRAANDTNRSERASDAFAHDVSLAELAFWLGDSETSTPAAECSSVECNQAHDLEPHHVDPSSAHECMLEHQCLQIPPSFYRRLAPLIPVIPLPRMDRVNLDDDDGWYSVGLREKTSVRPQLKTKSSHRFGSRDGTLPRA